MKKFLVLFFSIFICSIAHADTETINWYVDGTSYATTTCQTGGDIILPNTPTKYGYTFQGWANYIPIEYLESTGTQWIDTGIYGNSNLFRVTLGFQLNILPSNNTNAFIWGSFAQTHGSNGMGFVIRKADSVYYARLLYSDTDWKSTSVVYSNWLTNTVYDCECNYSVNNISLKLNNNEIININKNIGLYSTIRTLKIIDSSSVKIYYFKIYDNNVLVRDFIPVLDANGTPCMYDKVTQQFFYNQGTGNFIAGPVINQ